MLKQKFLFFIYTEMTNKDILLKYVESGLEIPSIQFENLPDKYKSIYIKNRIDSVGIDGLEDFEKYYYNEIKNI